MARILSAVPLVAYMAVVGSVAASTRHQQPAFSSKSDLVRVYATVRDKSGHLVTDLQQSDFEVRERGARVPLEVFSADVQPIRVAVMVDASGSFFERATFQHLRDGLSAFVGQLGPEDRATIGWFSGEKIFVEHPLTSDAAELRRQLDTELQIERVQPELAASIASKDSVAFAFQYRGRPLWNAIGTAAEKLKAEPGRKVVLVLANGDNTKLLPGHLRLSALKSLFASDELMVYGVHGFEPRLADERPDQIAGSYEERQTTLQNVTELTGGGYLIAPFDRRKRTLGMTGEKANLNPLSLAFRSQLAGIIEELRHQYTLGFVPTKRDGRVGGIEVRVTRPNTQVWARKTYMAPAE